MNEMKRKLHKIICFLTKHHQLEMHIDRSSLMRLSCKWCDWWKNVEDFKMR